MTTPTTEELRTAIEDAPAIIAFLKTLDPDTGIDTIDQDGCFYCRYLAARFPGTRPHANLVAITLRPLNIIVEVEEDSLADRLQRAWMERGFETRYQRAQASVFLWPPEAIEVVEAVAFEMEMEMRMEEFDDRSE